jgi:hypothetical protein
MKSGMAVAALLAGATAACAMLGSSGAWAKDAKTVDCKETTLKFEMPGYEVSCKDLSESSVNVSGMTIDVRKYTLYAVSRTDQTFLNVLDDHLLGTTRVYYFRRGFESDFEERFDAKFSGWADDEEIGGFDVKRVDVTFEGDDPMSCLAFRKLGGRRYSGISGMTLGMVCTHAGRDHAYDVLKHFSGGEG